MQCVREVETGESCSATVRRKYKIKGTGTVMRWVRQWAVAGMVRSFAWKKLMK